MWIKDLHIDRLLNAVKRRWLAGTIIFLVVGVFVTATAWRQPDVYQAVCKIEFSAQAPELSFDSRTFWRYSSYILQNLHLTSQRIIMMSDPVLDRVVSRLRLADAESEERFANARRAVAAAIQIERVPDSSIFLIRTRHQNPQMAKDLANTTAEAYIRYRFEKENESYRLSIQWLEEEIIDLKKKLEMSQRTLIDFIEREKITSFGNEQGAVASLSPTQNFAEIERLLEKLHARKVEEEMKLVRVQDKYLPAHPEYKRLSSEISLIKKKIQEEENRLAGLRQGREREIIRAKKNEIEYSILEREVEVNKEIYDTLVKKYKETDIGSAIAHADANIVEYAKLPTGPSYPNRQLQAVLIWLFSLIFGLGYCIAVEYLDTTLRTTQDIETYFEAPLLSVIGKEKDSTKLGRAMLEGSRLAGEAFRFLRTNLNFSFPRGDQGRLILVGSADKGEGKTTITANLAIVTAELGRKTLLIDGDLRARGLSKLFHLDDAVGLTTYLVGECSLEQTIKSTDIDNLWIIPAGSMPPQPATLLDSDLMQQTLQSLRVQFDEIFIDAPPFGVVIDSSIITSMVDGVIMVIEAGNVSRYLIQRAVDEIERLKAHLCGFVLNKTSFHRGRYYPYSTNYYGDTNAAKADGQVVDFKNAQSGKKLRR